MIRTQQIDSLIVLLLIAALPVSMLTDLGHASGTFYVIIIACAAVCLLRTGGVRATHVALTPYRGLAWALSVWVAVVFISVLYDHRLLDAEIERALRISAGPLIVLGACLMLDPRWLRQSVWGMAAAAWAATGYAVWLTWPNFRRPEDVPQYNAVSYSNLLLLLAVITAYSIGWQLTRFARTEKAIKILTLVVGVVGLVATQSRSGWMAIPVYLAIGLALAGKRVSLARLIGAGLVGIALAVALFASNPILRDRAQDVVDEVRACETNPTTISSVCIRIQLWRSAWTMFRRSPIIGNGSTDEFPRELEKLVAAKEISNFTITEEFDEPHNDMLFSMASHGVLGLLALLLVYLAPATIFVRRLSRDLPQQTRVAAAIGLAVCLGFMVYGLTELMFRGMRTMGFYAVMMGWALALSDPRALVGDKPTA